jgi:hypothetical protein
MPGKQLEQKKLFVRAHPLKGKKLMREKKKL